MGQAYPSSSLCRTVLPGVFALWKTPRWIHERVELTMTSNSHAFGALPGYRCGELTAQVGEIRQWAGRGPGNAPVHLRCVQATPSQALRWRRRLTTLSADSIPGCVPVRTAAVSPTHCVTWSVDSHPAATLTQWKARRGRLDAGQTERMVAGLSKCLRALHERGLVAGELRPESVVLDGDGEVQLDPSWSLPDQAHGPREDLVGLLQLVADFGGGAANRRERDLDDDLADALDEAARSSDPGVAMKRISSAAATARERRAQGTVATSQGSDPARAVLADLAADTVRDHVLAAPTNAPPPNWWQRIPRAWALGVLALTMCVLGVLLGPVVSSPTQLLGRSAVVPPPEGSSIESVLRFRDGAFTSGSPSALARAVLPGSRAWSSDVALLREVRREHMTIIGMHTRLLREPEWLGPDQAQLLVAQAPQLRTGIAIPRFLMAQSPRCFVATVDPSGRIADRADCGDGSD